MEVKRKANFELLRIVAMLMIISLHYLVKGGIATPFPFAAKENPVGVFAWFVESFCIVAVNCYVLLSGYFLREAGWKPGRIGALFGQVLSYSLLLPVFLCLFGVVSAGELDVYDWIGFVFPFGTEHYWFATAYLVMYLFAPFVTAGMEKMKKRNIQVLLVFLLLFMSLEKTLLPVRLATDRYGYDFGWFLCLLVLAGYIRLYGISWLEKKSHALSAYVFSCLLIWLSALFSNTLSGTIDAFSYYADMPYTYNHLLCLAGSVSLFYVFKNMRIEEGRFAVIVRKLAPCTFGVYLLHEHILVRYEWMRWLGVEEVSKSFLFIPHMIGCILLVYMAGTAVDAVRAWLFGRMGKALPQRAMQNREKKER